MELVSAKSSQGYEASPLPQLNRPSNDKHLTADHDTDLELMSNHSEAGRDDTDYTQPFSPLRTSIYCSVDHHKA